MYEYIKSRGYWFVLDLLLYAFAAYGFYHAVGY